MQRVDEYSGDSGRVTFASGNAISGVHGGKEVVHHCSKIRQNRFLRQFSTLD
jgi:hypothetical protein